MFIPQSFNNLTVSSEVCEHACSITTLALGETMPNVAKDMDIHSYRLPIGVTAGITPFNFPAMIPLWVSVTQSPQSIYSWSTSTSCTQNSLSLSSLP